MTQEKAIENIWLSSLSRDKLSLEGFVLSTSPTIVTPSPSSEGGRRENRLTCIIVLEGI
jgi:hypothetical protein